MWDGVALMRPRAIPGRGEHGSRSHSCVLRRNRPRSSRLRSRHQAGLNSSSVRRSSVDEEERRIPGARDRSGGADAASGRRRSGENRSEAAASPRPVSIWRLDGGLVARRGDRARRGDSRDGCAPICANTRLSSHVFEGHRQADQGLIRRTLSAATRWPKPGKSR